MYRRVRKASSQPCNRSNIFCATAISFLTICCSPTSIMVANPSHLYVLYFLITACNVFVAGQNPGHGIEARQETDLSAATNPRDFYARAYHACMVHPFRIQRRLFTDTIRSYRPRAIPVHRWRRNSILCWRRQYDESPGYLVSNPV